MQITILLHANAVVTVHLQNHVWPCVPMTVSQLSARSNTPHDRAVIYSPTSQNLYMERIAPMPAAFSITTCLDLSVVEPMQFPNTMIALLQEQVHFAKAYLHVTKRCSVSYDMKTIRFGCWWPPLSRGEVPSNRHSR